MPLRIGVYGPMVGQRNYGQALVCELKKLGAETVILQPSGPLLTEAELRSTLDWNLALLGAGAFPKDRESEEQFAAFLDAHQKPFGVAGDVPESPMRTRLDGAVFNGARFFISAEPITSHAELMGWRGIEYFGLPPHLVQSYGVMINGSREGYQVMRDG